MSTNDITAEERLRAALDRSSGRVEVDAADLTWVLDTLDGVRAVRDDCRTDANAAREDWVAAREAADRQAMADAASRREVNRWVIRQLTTVLGEGGETHHIAGVRVYPVTDGSGADWTTDRHGRSLSTTWTAVLTDEERAR